MRTETDWELIDDAAEGLRARPVLGLGLVHPVITVARVVPDAADPASLGDFRVTVSGPGWSIQATGVTFGRAVELLRGLLFVEVAK